MSLSRLQLLYKNEIIVKLKENLKIKFPPRLEKIVLNTGLGRAVSNKKYLEIVMENMTAVSGQKAIYTLARQSNAGFSIRTGWPIGCKVTLRKHRMYEFLDRYLNIVLPRIPDFQGLNSKSFDGFGNYTMGISDFAVFPECDISQEKLGLDITFVTTAQDDKAAYSLLSLFNFPFIQEKQG